LINILFVCITAILSYLIGSINTSIIYSKLREDDIRNHGSKNAGATNTLRTYGKKACAIVVIGDALKGIVAILLSMGLFKILNIDRSFYNIGKYTAAFCAVLGHNFPVFFGFRGGKGILTSVTSIFLLDYRCALIIFVVGILLIAIFKMVSLGSCAGALIFPFCAYYINGDMYFVIFAVLASVLSLIRHKDNIKRILNGTESKIGQKK